MKTDITATELIPKVLLVDDDVKNIFALETILEPVKIKTVSATSGEVALEMLMQDEYALILLDVQMPGMDGFETAALIQQNSRLKNIPIIFVTAINKENHYIKQGHEVGAVDYLFKPIEPSILLSKVRIFLSLYSQNKQMKSLITQLNQAQEDLANSNKELTLLAKYDAVTGLANRVDLTEFLERALLHAKRYKKHIAVLFLDLDNFKHTNDNYGHQAGDILLKQVSVRLKSCVRQSDTVGRSGNENLVSRLGGDEFAIVLTEIDKVESIAYVAQRIISELNKPFNLDEATQVFVGVSIGIACYPYAGEDAVGLFKKADMAMYDAKKRGKNTYRYFSEELNQAHYRNLFIEEGIKSALESQQFYLVYQPIVDLKSKKTIGLEVLCRCKSTELQDVSPQKIIEVAEAAGLMPDLGKRIFKAAIEEASELLFPLHNKLYLHINVSTKQLQNEDFIDYMAVKLEKTGVSPEKIIMEITETAIMADTSLLEKHLNKISGIGARISIDDFGTGYSSMVWLRHLPVSSLKIDKEFVGGVCHKQNDAIITKSIVRLAENLELTAIAEGIETQEQLDFLVEQNCPMGQGYFFSRPLEVKLLLEYLANKK